MLSFKYTINTITKKICLEDETDWTSLGFNTGTDTFSFLYNIVDPLGNLVYKTTGYDSDDFSSADVDNICKDLSTITGGDLMSGDYVVNIKAQVTGDTEIYTQDKTINFCTKLGSTTGTIKQEIDCSKSLIKTTDTTSYGNFDSIVRAHTLYYPSSLENDPIVSVLKTNTVTPIYTGTWTVKVVATVTYLLSANVYQVEKLETIEEFKVDCDETLCKFICCFDKFRGRLLKKIATNPLEAESMRKDYNLAFNEWQLAKQMKYCGKEVPESMLQNIYTLLECTEDCDCEGDEPTLVVALSTSDTFLSSSEIVEDAGTYSLVQTMSDGTVFTNELPNLGGADGADGEDGADGADGSDGEDGADGSALLFNEYYAFNDATAPKTSTGTGVEDLITHTTASALADGDCLKIKATFRFKSDDTYFKSCLLTVGSFNIAAIGIIDTLDNFFSNHRISIDCEIYRDGTKLYATYSTKVGGSVFGNAFYTSPRQIVEITGEDETSALVIKQQGQNGDDDGGISGPTYGDELVIAEQLMITLLKQ